MSPDSSAPDGNRSSDDALSLFGHEPQRPGASSGESGLSSDSDDALPLNGIIGGAPLRFVEGVAIVQALAASAKEKGGMPNLDGVFVKNTGELVVVGPPSVEPAARELARLLHRLVPAESTPPVGRLFIDRWASGASNDLTEFTSELAYFARPNGPELVSAIHARSAGKPAGAMPVPPLPVQVGAKAVEIPPRVAVQAPAPDPVAVSWLRSHRRQIVVAVAAIVMTVGATGLVTWFLPSRAAEAAAASAEADGSTTPKTATAKEPATTTKKDKPLRGRPAAPSESRLSAASAATTRTDRRAAGPELMAEGGRPAAIAPPGAVNTADVAGSAAPSALPSRAAPDMRIYSAADSGIEPPKLRSNEIPEFLIAGFERRANSVEVIVNARGSVERVRMLGTPQRIPDIMLLSRVKEWLFDPATTTDGAAVRYRMVLTWNVTP